MWKPDYKGEMIMSLKITHLYKSFGEHKVINNLSFTAQDKGIYCLMGASGIGKTTLLRIIMGLEKMDSGTVEGADIKDISAVFQENRLCEELTPIENIALVCKKDKSYKEIKDSLRKILPQECLTQPVNELSGGMKRRVAIARAMVYGKLVIIMDEPFTGLDTDTKKTVINYILEEKRDRIVIISTHGEEDAKLLGANKVRFENIMDAI